MVVRHGSQRAIGSEGEDVLLVAINRLDNFLVEIGQHGSCVRKEDGSRGARAAAIWCLARCNQSAIRIGERER